MNNEEKNIVENSVESTDVQPQVKKLSKGALIGIIGGAVAAILVAVILIIALGGKKCKAHVDADDDYKCDICETDFDDGDEAPEFVSADVTFSVKYDNGNPYPV